MTQRLGWTRPRASDLCGGLAWVKPGGGRNVTAHRNGNAHPFQLQACCCAQSLGIRSWSGRLRRSKWSASIEDMHSWRSNHRLLWHPLDLQPYDPLRCAAVAKLFVYGTGYGFRAAGGRQQSQSLQAAAAYTAAQQERRVEQLSALLGVLIIRFRAASWFEKARPSF